MSLTQSDAIREVLARLDAQAALQAELQMMEALEQHAPLQQEYIPSEADLADYHAYCLQVEATNYQRWLNDPREPS